MSSCDHSEFRTTRITGQPRPRCSHPPASQQHGACLSVIGGYNSLVGLLGRGGSENSGEVLTFRLRGRRAVLGWGLCRCCSATARSTSGQVPTPRLRARHGTCSSEPARHLRAVAVATRSSSGGRSPRYPMSSRGTCCRPGPSFATPASSPVQNAKDALCVAACVPVQTGHDVLVAYRDGSVRYVNFSGAAVVLNDVPLSVAQPALDLLDRGRDLVGQIGPWTQCHVA